MMLDASPGSVVVWCSCGSYRTVRTTVTAARAAFDRHRESAHPRQATYVAAKRRARTSALTA